MWSNMVVIKVGQEVGRLVGADGIELGGKGNVDPGIGAWHKIVVVLIVGAALNDETVLLDKGLVVVDAKGFNRGDGRVGHGERSPLVTGDARAGREGHKLIITLCVACGIERNGAHGPRFDGVGRVFVLENLDVSTELKSHVVVIRGGSARDKGIGAEIFGHTVTPWKQVETADSVGDHVADHQVRKAFEGETVNAGA